MIYNENLKIIKKNEFKEFNPLILKNYKIYPRINKLNYLKHQFYIYVYLDPFNDYLEKDEILKVNVPGYETFYFAFEPFYVGKASSMRGYRLNHHLNDFINNRNYYNKSKEFMFKKIESQMKENKDPSKPSNWKEYKDLFIIPLIEFDNEEELLNFEMNMINILGTTDNGGMLVNKITKYQQNKFKNHFDF